MSLFSNNNSELKVQMPSVAGMFYPAEPARLEADVNTMLNEATVSGKPTPKAIIAPHAGYIYSGPIAASAYALFMPDRDKIKRIVIMAPSHRLPLRGIAASSAKRFRTPLGDINVDKKALESVLELPQVVVLDEAFNGEHALEVHLPFLQQVLSQFSIVPFIVGSVPAQEVAEVLATLWGDTETRIVISSDLSHFLDYDSARVKDQKTTEMIEAFDYAGLDFEDACGRNPVKGLLYEARRRNLQVKTVDLRNSGDTAGDKSRVVGYGAYVFS